MDWGCQGHRQQPGPCFYAECDIFGVLCEVGPYGTAEHLVRARLIPCGMRGRGCEPARSEQKQLMSQVMPRWKLLPPKWCFCVPGPPWANPHCKMILVSPGFIDTVSSSDLTAWLSALLMLRCVGGAVRGRKRNSGTPITGDHHCQRPSQLFAANLGYLSLSLPPIQKNLKKMAQIQVISDCDYLRS